MSRSVYYQLVMLLLVCLVQPGVAAEGEATIVNKRFKLMSPDGANEIGQYVISAIAKDADKTIEIRESLSMSRRGKVAGYRSTVVYSSAAGLVPLKGSVVTHIGGLDCMKGTVTISKGAVDHECTGFLNERTLEPIDPPKHFVTKAKPLAKGMVVFQSALPAIGPRLLTKPGELNNIVFAEFPDDVGAPELINFKEGYRLVREEAEVNGEYVIKVFSPHPRFEEAISQYRFDKKDQMMTTLLFGKAKAVEVK